MLFWLSVIVHTYPVMFPVERLPSRVIRSPTSTWCFPTARATGGWTFGGGFGVEGSTRGGGGEAFIVKAALVAVAVRPELSATVRRSRTAVEFRSGTAQESDTVPTGRV